MQVLAQSSGRRIYHDIPWWFRMIRARIANNRRGPWLMLRMADRLGLLKAAAWFPLGDARILIPLDWQSRIHLPDRLATYEPAAIAHFAHEIDSFAGNATLIDCGADIGVYSRLVMQQTTKLQEIVLFEPNPQSYAILSRNFEAVGLPVRLFNTGSPISSAMPSCSAPTSIRMAHSSGGLRAAFPSLPSTHSSCRREARWQ